MGTGINLAFTLLAAYPLSRRDLPGRNGVMFVFILTMYFNGGLIPTYLLVRNLGMYNTIWAIVAVLVVYYGVMHWNSWFSALVYLRDEKLYPLQIVLRIILLLGPTEQLGSNEVGMGKKIKMAEGIKYSVIMVSSLPILMVYPFVQRYFVKGVMVGAVKG
jgi:putative aldouronate transport system permease protein